MSIIEMLGPRITDPRAKMNKILELFRYSEHKIKIEEIFKARSATILSSMFLTTPSSKAHGGIRSGLGRGGLRGSTSDRRTGTALKVAGVSSPYSLHVLTEVKEEKLAPLSPRNSIVHRTGSTAPLMIPMPEYEESPKNNIGNNIIFIYLYNIIYNISINN